MILSFLKLQLLNATAILKSVSCLAQDPTLISWTFSHFLQNYFFQVFSTKHHFFLKSTYHMNHSLSQCYKNPLGFHFSNEFYLIKKNPINYEVKEADVHNHILAINIYQFLIDIHWRTQSKITQIYILKNN